MSAYKYAKAIFDHGRGKGQLDEVSRQMNSFCKMIRGNDDFRAVFFNRWLDKSRKTAMIREYLKGSHGFDDFIALLIRRNMESTLFDIQESFFKLMDAEKGILRGSLEYVKPLPDDYCERIEAMLSKKTGKTVKLENIKVPDLIGGVRVRVGDTVYDGSLKGMLKDMSVHLKN
ncbi:MAG: ATP synthase F1 subunit delta [bacterium]